MNATPEVRNANDLDLPTYDSWAERMKTVNECDHPQDEVYLIHGPPSVEGTCAMCEACGDLL